MKDPILPFCCFCQLIIQVFIHSIVANYAVILESFLTAFIALLYENDQIALIFDSTSQSKQLTR